MRGLAERVDEVIRIDAVWIAVEPLDMRAGTDTALARVTRCSAKRVRITPICSRIGVRIG